MSITLLDDCNAIVLRTTNSAYAFCWGEAQAPLRHLHWGTPVSDDDVRALITVDPTTRSGITSGSPRAFVEEFPFAGGLRREEVAIKLELSDGVRSLDLAVHDVEVTAQHSVLATLVDTHYPVQVELQYRLDESADAIVRSARITNTGAEPLHV
ncbi:MAG: glycoside hydrolase family 36 N-terminal domain-containing protein, partial [Nakamurella sp.]